MKDVLDKLTMCTVPIGWNILDTKAVNVPNDSNIEARPLKPIAPLNNIGILRFTVIVVVNASDSFKD